MSRLRAWLSEPLVRGLELDDPRTIEHRRRLIQRKAVLRQIYQEWYATLAAALPTGRDPVLEIGSGPGFIDQFIPGVITSEMLPCRDVRLVLDAQVIPIASGALRAIVMTNVLHHLPQPRRFLAEAARCVRPGGVVAMIEPWVSRWSRLVYGRWHHEPFDPNAAEWERRAGGPLSAANGALPWMIFSRDRERFEHEFPQWEIQAIKPGMPFRYGLSGGVSMRSLMPAIIFPVWASVERSLEPWMAQWAMFAEIKLVRR